MRVSERAADKRAPQLEGSPESGGGVWALERGLQLIKCFDIDHPSWRIADLARAVGLHKATARRLVEDSRGRRLSGLEP